MSTTAYELLAASSHNTLDVTAAFLGGLVIAGALVWAIRFGMKIRDQELPRPLPEEQPHLPATGAVHEMREMREPDEMPIASEEKERLMPYELHHSGSRTGKDQKRQRWIPGRSGSFGGGGIGRV
jgi:hypothetical protein